MGDGSISEIPYDTIGGGLQPYNAPTYCGDALPTFKSKLLTIRRYPGPSVFGNDAVFSLDGALDNTSGHVTATRISGEGPDHQLIFGSSKCCRSMFGMSGAKKRWPLTIVINGQKITSLSTYAEFRPSDGFVIMQYGFSTGDNTSTGENAELMGGPHYEFPSGGGCLPDEKFGRLSATGAEVCAPACFDSKCPTDVAEGVTATPVCGAMLDQSGNKFCALRCKSDDECGHDLSAECFHPQAGMPGICAFGKPHPPRMDTSNAISLFSKPRYCCVSAR